MFFKKSNLKYILYYLFIIIILVFIAKEAIWQRKLDVKYKQAIIELNEREDLNYERNR